MVALTRFQRRLRQDSGDDSDKILAMVQRGSGGSDKVVGQWLENSNE